MKLRLKWSNSKWIQLYARSMQTKLPFTRLLVSDTQDSI